MEEIIPQRMDATVISGLRWLTTYRGVQTSRGAAETGPSSEVREAMTLGAWEYYLKKEALYNSTVRQKLEIFHQHFMHYEWSILLAESPHLSLNILLIPAACLSIAHQLLFPKGIAKTQPPLLTLLGFETPPASPSLLPSGNGLRMEKAKLSQHFAGGDIFPSRKSPLAK
jgi:hypothetical protein